MTMVYLTRDVYDYLGELPLQQQQQQHLLFKHGGF